MPVEYEAPEVKDGNGVTTDYTITHPSYASISVTHPTGHNRKLFMSDLKHDRSVHVTINRAQQDRGLNSSVVINKGMILEFEMSFSQWAQLVSSSLGIPVPITLRRMAEGGKIKNIPHITDQDTEAELAERDIANTTRQAMAAAKELRRCLDSLRSKGKAGKKDLEELSRIVNVAYERLPEDIQFAASMFKEYQETLITEAKTEIESHIGEAIKDAGRAALSRQGYFDGKSLENKGGIGE